MTITTVAQASDKIAIRRTTGFPWLDELLGGGYVPSSVIMLHGEPGSGKSTLLAQVASATTGAVYASAEETASQVAQRVKRIGGNMGLPLIESANIDEVLSDAGHCSMLVIDSTQTMFSPSDESEPGGKKQVLLVGNAVVEYARRTGACVVLVVHQTKAGGYAGPATLEHLVDVSLGLQRESRIISINKNRYGRSDLACALTMTDRGLVPTVNAIVVKPKRKRWRFWLAYLGFLCVVLYGCTR